MNHGGLGYLNKNGELALHPDLLDLLCFGHGSSLYGLYYPRPKDDPKYKNISIDHDFMLTPIPPQYWNRCARLIIHLKQDERGALRKVSEILEKNSASIIHSESTRSGYKFATWTIHIAFTWLGENLTYKKKGQYYEESKAALDDLSEALYNKCHHCLFIDEDSEDLNEKNAIRFELNGELAYFYNKLHGENLPENEKINFEPFEMTLSLDGELPLLSANSRDIQKITNGLDFGNKTILPAITFAELDSKVLNVRMGVIPVIDSHKFIEIGIKYERVGENKKGNDSVGLMNALLDKLPSEYNLWRTYNFTKINTNVLEEGGIVLLIEDQDKSDVNDPKDRALKTCKRLESITSLNGMKVHIKAMPSTVNKTKILHAIKNAKHKLPNKKHVFISYNNEDQKYAKALAHTLEKNYFSTFCYSNDNQTGEEFYRKVKENLNSAWEVCVLCSLDSMKSEWVRSEWLAAWFMGKNISPLFLPGFRISDLPIKLMGIVGQSFEDMEIYISDLKHRAEINDIIEYNNFIK
ncbi:MAG: putative cytosolic protein [Flavipsychrobacter sp.]|nr:putative cytosolic protein [Flavipsychrobacter sp.]